MILFWYGVLHAFGPDHLAVIADFSIGRQRKKVAWVTLGFALGHGVSLYLFALLISAFEIPEHWLSFGDVIASTVILLMGAYLLYLVLFDQIHVAKHQHNGQAHIHIWFGASHNHSRGRLGWLSTPALLGVLMGMGGVKGMLVSLSAVSAGAVTAWMILSFTLGVALVFLVFGGVLAILNQRIIYSKSWLRGSFTLVGILSCGVGAQALI